MEATTVPIWSLTPAPLPPPHRETLGDSYPIQGARELKHTPSPINPFFFLRGEGGADNNSLTPPAYSTHGQDRLQHQRILRHKDAGAGI